MLLIAPSRSSSIYVLFAVTSTLRVRVKFMFFNNNIKIFVKKSCATGPKCLENFKNQLFSVGQNLDRTPPWADPEIYIILGELKIFLWR